MLPVLLVLLGVCYCVLFVFVAAHLLGSRMLGRGNSVPNTAYQQIRHGCGARKTRCRLPDSVYQAVSLPPLPAQIQPASEFYL